MGEKVRHSAALFPSDGKKQDAIADAGLSKTTAYRYQDIAGPRDEQAQKAGKAAAEKYFAEARATKVPATMNGLWRRHQAQTRGG